ncbi:hypothetical protein YC2023_095704 [Brassica napus]
MMLAENKASVVVVAEAIRINDIHIHWKYKAQFILDIYEWYYSNGKLKYMSKVMKLKGMIFQIIMNDKSGNYQLKIFLENYWTVTCPANISDVCFINEVDVEYTWDLRQFLIDFVDPAKAIENLLFLARDARKSRNNLFFLARNARKSRNSLNKLWDMEGSKDDETWNEAAPQDEDLIFYFFLIRFYSTKFSLIIDFFCNKTRGRHVLAASQLSSPKHLRVANPPPPRKIYDGEFSDNSPHLGSTSLPHLFRLQTSPPYQTKHFIHRKPHKCQTQPPKNPPSTTVLNVLGFIGYNTEFRRESIDYNRDLIQTHILFIIATNFNHNRSSNRTLTIRPESNTL